MKKQLIAVIFMAIVTYLPRVIPITVFRNEIKSKFLKSFLHYVPYAVLGAMIFPDILGSTQSNVSAVIGGGVAVLLSFFEKSLMTVIICSVCAVYVCELFL